MMYVQSLKLLATLHAQRERERSESIEPGDDAAAIARSRRDTSAIQNSWPLKSNEYRRRK
jgi:hypothetical protein